MAESCVSVPSAGSTPKNSVAIEIVHISATILSPAIEKALMSWSPDVTTVGRSTVPHVASGAGSARRQSW